MAVKPGSFFKKPYGNASATSPRDAFVQSTANQLSNFGSAYSPRPASFTQPGLPGAKTATNFKQAGIPPAPLQPNIRTPQPAAPKAPTIPTAFASTTSYAPSYAPSSSATSPTSPSPGLPNTGNSPTRQLRGDRQAQETSTPPTRSAYDMAVTAYLDSLKESPSVRNARQKYVNFIQSRDTGLQNIEDQPIPMQFITGQQRSLSNRAEIQADRLQGDIGLAEGSQQSRREFAKALLDIETERNQPLAISAGQSLLTRDGKGGFQTAYTAPSEAGNVQTELTDIGGNKVLINKQTGEVIRDLGEKKDVTQLTEYQAERAQRVIEQVDDAIKNIGPYTTGFGALLSAIPESKARDFKAKIESIKANIGFNELQAMRAASPTGGALGQVAVQELNFLQSVLGSLDTKQSPAQLQQNLEQIKTHFNNWLSIVNQAKQTGGGSTGGGNIYDF